MMILNISLLIYFVILLEFEDKFFFLGESVYRYESVCRYDDMVCCDMICYAMT